MGGHFQQGVERYWNLGGKMKKNIREGFRKTKWKFSMEFSMKGVKVSSSIKVFSIFFV